MNETEKREEAGDSAVPNAVRAFKFIQTNCMLFQIRSNLIFFLEKITTLQHTSMFFSVPPMASKMADLFSAVGLPL